MTTHILGVDTSTLAFAATLGVVGAVALSLAVRRRRSRAVRSPAAEWPNTRGTVLSATATSTSTTTDLTPANNTTTTTTTVATRRARKLSLVLSGSPRCSELMWCSAATTVARYPAGSCVEVYYDPLNPANSALER